MLPSGYDPAGDNHLSPDRELSLCRLRCQPDVQPTMSSSCTAFTGSSRSRGAAGRRSACVFGMLDTYARGRLEFATNAAGIRSQEAAVSSRRPHDSNGSNESSAGHQHRRSENDPANPRTTSSARGRPGFGQDVLVNPKPSTFGRVWGRRGRIRQTDTYRVRPRRPEYDLAAPSTTSSARARPRRAETDHRITTTTQTATPIKHEEPLHTPVASRGAQCYAPWVSKADSEMRRTRRRRAYAGATRMRGCGHTCRRADEPVPPASTPHIHASRRPRRHRQPQRIRECQRP